MEELAPYAAFALFILAWIGAYSARHFKGFLAGMAGIFLGGGAVLLIPGLGWDGLLLIPLGAVVGFVACWGLVASCSKNTGAPLFRGKARVAAPAAAALLFLAALIYSNPQSLSNFAAAIGHRRTYSLLLRLGIPAEPEPEDRMFVHTPPQEQEDLLIAMLAARESSRRGMWRQDSSMLLQNLCGKYNRPDLLPSAATFLLTHPSILNKYSLNLAIGDTDRISPECLRSLLDAGVPLDTATGGEYSLHSAAARHHWEHFSVMLDYKPDLTRKDYSGRPLLSSVAAAGRGDLLERLIAMGAPLDAMDIDGRTALHVAAFAGQPDCVRVLLRACLDPNAKDADGATPLLLACRGAGGPLVEMLAVRGVPPDLVDMQNNTPSIFAHSEQFLWSTSNAPGGFRWWEASRDRNDDRLPEASPAADRHAGATETVRLLLESGADPLIMDKQGRNAMHYAAVREDTIFSVGGTKAKLNEAHGEALFRALKAAGAEDSPAAP